MARLGYSGAFPRRLFSSYYADLEAGDFSRAASRFHPEEVESFRRIIAPIFDCQATPHCNEIVEAMFGPEETPSSVTEMTAQELMGAFLESVGRRMASEAIEYSHIDVLGSIADGDDVFVTARIRLGSGDLQVTSTEVIGVRQFENDWRILLDGRMEEVAKTMRQQAKEQAETLKANSPAED